MSTEQSKNEPEKTPEEIAQEYDDGWDDDDEPAPAAKPEGEDTEEDDDDNPNPDDPELTDEPDTGKPPAGEEDDPDAKAKEEQRRKSWEGRVRAEEQRVKADKEKVEAEKKALAEKKAKVKEALAAGDDETDWDAVAAELEMPELAKMGKDIQRTRELQREQHAIAEEEAAIAERERQADDSIEKAKAHEAHNNAILEKHPDVFDVVESAEFNEWKASLKYAKGAQYDQVLKQGTASQVNEMLDDFKQSARGKPKPNDLASPRSSNGNRRRLGAPDMNDYDASWDEDD